MVYDVSGNFVGDTHWQNAESIQDGDELKLDRGVIIQVTEETGRTDQDLSELLDRKIAGKEDSPIRRRHQHSSRQYSVPLTSSDGRISGRKPKSIRAILTASADAPQKVMGDSAPPFPWQGDTVGVAMGPPDSNTKRRKIAHQESRHLPTNSEAMIATKLQKHSGAGEQGSVISKDPRATVQHDRRSERRADLVARDQQSVVSSKQVLGPFKARQRREEAHARTSTPSAYVTQDNVSRPKFSLISLSQSEYESIVVVEAQKPLQTLMSNKRTRRKLICQDAEQSKGRVTFSAAGNESPEVRLDGGSILRQDSSTATGLEVAKTDSAARGSQEIMPNVGRDCLDTEVSPVRGLNRVTELPKHQRGMQNTVDLGPWSREAFDLFGWQQGQPKGLSQK
ncbi:hypothetical protein MMC10_000511 [Thelotrema lepadinum]|nr:hypothetical protein [Thelotrema lepadinum]